MTKFSGFVSNTLRSIEEINFTKTNGSTSNQIRSFFSFSLSFSHVLSFREGEKKEKGTILLLYVSGVGPREGRRERKKK